MQNQSTPNAQQNARTLRREMTDSERKLWSGLRSEQLGVKFRRQHPLGTYIADFACLDPKLIVELDGSQHQVQQGYDARRDTFLRTQGFEVLRFGSNDPFVNFEGVLQAVLNRLNELKAACPHPNLPPEGEGAHSRSHP
ncbi:endonuclease domain-containing protein [Variovorax sp. EBFNA2]|uniref:endonuclease domain-containing protein n=1 Tax=Variovorax sp. EBFNA2 TaxID=3342097 RepID=UPI0029BFAEEC|nr:endonuclease domain-containing protein [Variovorax boronicumulans]WPG38434.1 endonuclease domain-containing protein [Variovorax boronicumulans]